MRLSLSDERTRGVLIQLAVAGLTVALAALMVWTAAANLEAQNKAFGFEFLDDTAGFGIAQTLIPYSETSPYARVFFVGLLNTLLVALAGIAIATPLGFFVGIARLSSNWLVARIAEAYVEVLRNVPLLLQIFFWYFAVLRTLPLPRDSLSLFDAVFLNNRGLFLPATHLEPAFWAVAASLAAAIGATVYLARRSAARRRETGEGSAVFWPAAGLIIGLPLAALVITGFPFTVELPEQGTFNLRGGINLMPELVALTLALATYTAAFIAEIVRAGIQGVNRGQSEAAGALGLTRSQTLRLVVIPQAMRIIIPPLTSQYLNLTKNSSLAVAIAYPDLVSVFAGTVLNQTGRAIEILAMTMAVYLTLSLITALIMNLYNRRLARTEAR